MIEVHVNIGTLKYIPLGFQSHLRSDMDQAKLQICKHSPLFCPSCVF